MTAVSSWHWIALVLAALLALGGVVIVALALFRDRARGRPRCPRCWYDMAGATTLKCPECGREVRSAKKLLRTRRRWRRAALGVVMLVVAGATAVGEPMLREGVVAGAPTWGYIAALPWLENGSGMKELQRRVDSGTMRQWEYRALLHQCTRTLPRATTPDQRLDLLDVLTHIEIGARSGPRSRPYASWASLREDDATRAIDVLLPLLDDESERVRPEATKAIDLLGARSRRATPALLGHLAVTPRADLQMVILVVFRWPDGGPELEGLFSLPQMPLESVNSSSAALLKEFRALRDCGLDSNCALSVLRPALTHNDGAVRECAVRALACVEGIDQDMRSHVLALASDHDSRVRRAVVEFAAHCPAGSDADHIVADAFRDPSADVQAGALDSAAHIGTNEALLSKVRPLLAEELTHSRAVRAWLKLGGDTQVAVDSIMERLRRLRRYGGDDPATELYLLASVGNASRETIDEIAPMMGALSTSLSCAAAYAYASIGGDISHATRCLIDEIRASRGSVERRWSASYGAFGLAASRRLDIPLVAELLVSDQADERKLGAQILAALGDQAATSLPKLRALRHDPDPQVAEMADHAVKRIEWELQHPEEAAKLRESHD